MKRGFISLLFLFTYSFLLSQDDDYVISDPAKTVKKNQSIPIDKDRGFLPNSDYSNYFLTSTAFTLKKGSIRLSGSEVVFVKGSYGITDNTMASVNLSFFGTSAISLKHRININEGLNIAATISGGRLFYVPLDTSIYYGGGQAIITLGDSQDNLTAGTGFYYIKSSFDLIDQKRELFVNTFYIGGQKQISRKVFIILEGIYFINYRIITGAAGVKLIMTEKISLNFGLMPLAWNEPRNNQTNIEPGAIPIVSFRMLLNSD